MRWSCSPSNLSLAVAILRYLSAVGLAARQLLGAVDAEVDAVAFRGAVLAAVESVSSTIGSWRKTASSPPPPPRRREDQDERREDGHSST
jgi:hypothetical protein